MNGVFKGEYDFVKGTMTLRCRSTNVAETFHRQIDQLFLLSDVLLLIIKSILAEGITQLCIKRKL